MRCLSPAPFFGVLAVAAFAVALGCLWLDGASAQGVGISINATGAKSAGKLMGALSAGYLYHNQDAQIVYTANGETESEAMAPETAFGIYSRGIRAQHLIEFGIVALPLAGQAMVMAYNLPEFDRITDPPLLVDRATLAAIWLGDIYSWNDTAIRRLNPDLAHRLPERNITIGINDGHYLGPGAVMRVSLESFYAPFGPEFAARGGLFAKLRPAVDGRAVSLSDSSLERLEWLAAYPYGLTFADYSDMELESVAQTLGVRHMRMINKAGAEVTASVSSTQAALREFKDAFASNNLTIDTVDAPGNSSWPIVYTVTVSMGGNMKMDDCSVVTATLQFFAWAHSNAQARDTMTTLCFAPLDNNLKKRVLDTLGSIKCSNSPAYTTGLVVGYGAPLTLVNSWANAWTTAATVASYFTTNSSDAVDLQINYSGDFGITIRGASPTKMLSMPDAVLMPLTAFALVPAYHVKSVNASHNLVLSHETVAYIYLGEITRWNDSRIAALNSPEVIAMLPDNEIVVVVHDVDSDYNLAFTSFLSERVPAFRSVVGPSRLPQFPALAVPARRGTTTLYTTDDFGVGDVLVRTPWAFAMWPRFALNLASGYAVVRAAALDMGGGVVVQPSAATVEAALASYVARGGALASADPIMVRTPGAWPLVALVSAIYRSQTMESCPKAAALADFLYWSQTSTVAREYATKQQYVLAGDISALSSMQRRLLADFECDGAPVSALAACVDSSTGAVCSGRGTCRLPAVTSFASMPVEQGACDCPSGWTGPRCDVVASSSGDSTLTVVLATVLPLLAVLVCAVMVVATLMMALALRRRAASAEWEIDFDELEMGDPLGQGGYGEVHRAKWRGTDVAVKTVRATGAAREAEANFRDEVRIMTALRHPNVVLFMAACTKSPHLCIVMEYMALGSLYDLLHNELVPDLPLGLKLKMAYQAAKGMHFLHSSGIVHRDLKSLNLLLDAKWNVKVSDFGLTKFRSELASQGNQRGQAAGSVHWTAPEVLQNDASADFMLADVYSFGIILWELMTRLQPYFGLTPAAIAVAVIRDHKRPFMSSKPDDAHPADFVELLQQCWHQDPIIRPAFLEIMTRLSVMIGDSSSRGTGVFASSSGGITSSSASEAVLPARRDPDASWSLPSGSERGADDTYDKSLRSDKDRRNSGRAIDNSTSGSSNGSSAEFARGAGPWPTKAHATNLAHGPRGPPTNGPAAIVFTDITAAASLWQSNPTAMRDATLLHNELLRADLSRFTGYEVSSCAAAAKETKNGRAQARGTGAFCMVFHRVADALAWCASAQHTLLNADWPPALLQLPAAAIEESGQHDQVVHRGLRVRMAVHWGTPATERDRTTGRYAYSGHAVDLAGHVTVLAHGGQIVVTREARDRLGAEDDQGSIESLAAWAHVRLVDLGRFDLGQLSGPHGQHLYEARIHGLEARFFGGVAAASSVATSSSATTGTSDTGSGAAKEDDGSGLRTAIGEQRAYREDAFLNSANICRWVISYDEIALGEQIGTGSYGTVMQGRWKGVAVAVKRFVKQRLGEKQALEFRTEVALLSELMHPNVVVFIGACVAQPNLCIVTELAGRGSLAKLLDDGAARLSWLAKLRLMRSAALGIQYLHGLVPPIVHRDIKPSNLLVFDDETGGLTLKVADFGFARIKDENATMTRCGTPYWTAPEVIRGAKYDEKVDVYSFAIVMWQIITRKHPYDRAGFMDATIKVLEGHRPQLPDDLPKAMHKLIRKSWHNDPAKRPAIGDVIVSLNKLLGEHAPFHGTA